MKLIFLHEDANTAVVKKLYGRRREYTIYLVDGESARNLSKADEEFGGVAIHPQFPKLIPEDEIWIEKNSSANEIPILIDTALYQLQQIDAGKSQDEAYKAAIKREKREREILDSAEHRDERPGVIPKSTYVKLYKTLRDGTKVWLVNSEEVRNHTKTDFMEGGHSYVYNFVPKGEVWLENGLNIEELPFILYHELTERVLMRDKNMKYDDAHEIASDKEYEARKSKTK
jgi:hypothetical protein